MGSTGSTAHREPWNKGKIVGQKAPFKLKDIWALRVRLQMEGRVASAITCSQSWATRGPQSDAQS
ncbi:putative integrase/recombinase [Comamonas thiooxydans]|nr:putative integrase/recombinase [Comamonas thiooxydans]